MGVSFETCLRRCGDVLIGRRCYVLFRRRHDVPTRRRGAVILRRLVDVPSRRRWCFIWDVPATSLGSTERHRDVLAPRRLVAGWARSVYFDWQLLLNG